MGLCTCSFPLSLPACVTAVPYKEGRDSREETEGRKEGVKKEEVDGREG